MFYHIANAWGTNDSCDLLEFSAILDTDDGVVEWFSNDYLLNVIESGIKIKGCSVRDMCFRFPSLNAFVAYEQRLEDTNLRIMLSKAFKEAQDLIAFSDCFDEVGGEVHFGTYSETCDAYDVPLEDR